MTAFTGKHIALFDIPSARLIGRIVLKDLCLLPSSRILASLRPEPLLVSSSYFLKASSLNLALLSDITSKF